MKSKLAVAVLVFLLAAAACQKQIAGTSARLKPPEQQTEIRALPANSSPTLKLVIDGAIEQVGKTTGYDASYQKIDYPNGDVPIETGVCSDVIVRAFRNARIDLQKEVHEWVAGFCNAAKTSRTDDSLCCSERRRPAGR